MIHYNEISGTDADKVCRVRRAEILAQINLLNRVVTDFVHDADKRKMNWGDVGSLSHICEQLETLNASFGQHADENEIRETFGLKK